MPIHRELLCASDDVLSAILYTRLFQLRSHNDRFNYDLAATEMIV